MPPTSVRGASYQEQKRMLIGRVSDARSVNTAMWRWMMHFTLATFPIVACFQCLVSVSADQLEATSTRRKRTARRNPACGTGAKIDSGTRICRCLCVNVRYWKFHHFAYISPAARLFLSRFPLEGVREARRYVIVQVRLHVVRGLWPPKMQKRTDFPGDGIPVRTSLLKFRANNVGPIQK